MEPLRPLSSLDTEDQTLVVDSLTLIGSDAAGQVLVAGSHGGLIAGWYALRSGAKAVLLNDAGVGKDNAGIAALPVLSDLGMAAATVSRSTALIGSGSAMLGGTISFANEVARCLGVVPGQPSQLAIEQLKHATPSSRQWDWTLQARSSMTIGSSQRMPVVACDSIGHVHPEDAGCILIIGSHAALHGDDSTALQVDAAAAFFHDAAFAGDPRGVSRLPVLSARGIPAFAVGHESARIGDARSMLATGLVSCVNDCAARRGFGVGLTVRKAIKLLQEQRRVSAAGYVS